MLRDGNGNWIDNVDELHDMVNNFYKDLLFSLEINHMEWILSAFTYPILEATLRSKLDAHINLCKAPGLDGFPAGLSETVGSCRKKCV